MKSGIYQIRNTLSNKCYIGSASNSFTKRWQNHRSELNLNKHHSVYLQRAWNKYGADVFVFEVLLYCDPENCLMYEQSFLDSLKPVYNTARDAKSPMLGRKHSKSTKRQMSISHLGKTHSNETCQKISQSNKGNKSNLGHRRSQKTKTMLSKQKLGENNPNYGKFGEMNPNSKLTNSERYKITILYREGKTSRELAALFGVAQSTIYRTLKEYL